MFQLGEKIYDGAIGFETFEQVRESDYKEQALIGTKPTMQRVGDKLDTVPLTVRLHNAYCTPEDEIDSLENSRAVGYILSLFSRGGRYYGDFLIKTLRTRIERGNGDGTILLATVDIELVEYYYKDRAAAERRARQVVGFANPNVAIPFPEIPVPPEAQAPAPAPTAGEVQAVVAGQTMTTATPPTKTRAAATLGRLTQMAGTAARLVATVRQAASNPARRVYLLREAARGAGDLSQQYGALLGYLNNTANPTAATSGLLYALSGGSGAGGATLPGLAGILQGQATSGDYAGAATTASQLQAEQARLTAAAMPIATSAGVGRNIL